MIDRIEPSSSSIREYISARKPCIITSLPEEFACFSDCLDLSFLSKYAGHLPVSVEPISSKGTFGTADTKTNMLFTEFLQKLQAKDKVYLTTQYMENEDSAVLSEPLLTLRQQLDFPLVPKIANDLLTAKINIWLGTSTEGTSSGLHHDFHDNFYALLSGQKKFRIFKPSWKACEKLKVQGRPHEIFENGLISYDGTLCSDGLTATTKAQIRVEVRDKALAEARSTDLGLQEAEALYEEAMDQLLEAKLKDDDGSEDGDFEANTDFEDEAGGYEDNDGDNEEDGETTQYLAERLATKSDHIARRENNVLSEVDSPQSVRSSSEEPASFSSLSSQEVLSMVEDTSLEGSEFVLQKGEMLYLPASYFHEVISISGQQDFHMAINYWFYPPDLGNGSYQDLEVTEALRERLSESYPNISSDASRPLKKRRT